MLVLTRKISESIRLTCEDNTEITITVLGWKNHGGIKLGIDAPREMKVLRGELIEMEKVTNAHQPS